MKVELGWRLRLSKVVMDLGCLNRDSEKDINDDSNCWNAPAG